MNNEVETEFIYKGIEDSIKQGLELIKNGVGSSDLTNDMNYISIELYKSVRDRTGLKNEWLEGYIKKLEVQK
jgi:hypothetical protein